MAKVLVFRCLSNCNVNYLVEQEEKDICCPPHEIWKIPELETLNTSTTIRREISTIKNLVM